MSAYSQPLFIAAGPLPNPETLRTEQPLTNAAKDDPSIAKGWETSVYVGSAFVVLGVLAIVGIFSQKIEHVVTMTLILTGILIACFLVMSL